MHLTIAVALGATLLDAALLQRKIDFFTGGFLSVEHLRGPGEILWFLMASLLADAGVGGILVAFGLLLARRLRLGTAAGVVLTFSVGLLPFLIADIASYRILEYLGGAFDFDLMFDLSGRKPAEIVAVAAAPMAQFGVLCILLTVGVTVVVSAVQRLRPTGSWHTAGVPQPKVLPQGFALLTLAFFVTAASRLALDSLDNGLRRKPAGVVLGWPARVATDFDGDGYGLFSRVRDPAAFEAAIHPYAIEIPGNGIDEDGVGGDLPATHAPYTEPSGASPQFVQRPDVVLIQLETFRADIVGATLNGRPVTPVLDALAARGISSRNAWSHNGYTVQSRFHLLTGSLANLRGGTTLIDDFLSQGYEAGYFSGQDESFGGGALPVGYERASVFFDARQALAERYTLFTTPGSLAVPFTTVLRRVRDFTSNRDASRPLFVHVNFHDTHFPYTHRFVEPLVDSTVVPRGEIAPSRRDALWRMYLNTAANVDKAIGQVLEAVRRSTGREPGVIVTADHGESLFEEGFLGHGYGLNEAQTRIPLVACGLPLIVREPWGQTDLRDDIRRALATEADAAARPTIVPRDSPILQYLGHVHAPAQIAFRTSTTVQTTYDFRTDRFRSNGGPWQDTVDLAEDARKAFLALLNYWETITVAQRDASRF